MRRIPELDGLRGVAILMVFVYHAFGVPFMWSGVDLFFVMSGYLITGILLRLKDRMVPGNLPTATKYLREFYVRRACRILPPYFLFLLVIGFFFPIPWPHVWPWYAFFAANIATAMSLVPLQAVIPLWSLAAEEQFYLVWPALVFLANRRTLKTVALTVIVTEPILRAVCTPLFHSHWPIYTLPFFRADPLAWGSFIAVSEHTNPSWIQLRRSDARNSAIAAGVILCALSVVGSFRYTHNSILFNGLGYSLLGIIFGGTLICVLGTQQGIIHWMLASKALRLLGTISYTFYLYHFGVLALIERIVHFHGISLISFAITGAIAAVSWKFLESPILAAAGRLNPRPMARAAVAGH